MSAEGMKPLAGMRVLDLSRVLAGPLCTQTLGDFGAEIIKVEPYGAGDDSRAWPPFHDGLSTAYLCYNRHKRSIVIDLKKPEGLEIVRKLAATADAVVENNTTGVAERLGIDYESMRKINPRIVYCTISGFGRSGPMQQARGYDLMLQAFSGMLSVTGAEGPARIPFSPIDQMTGYHAATGVLAALMRRERTGQGGLVEVSLFDTAIGLMGYLLQTYWETGTLPPRSGISHDAICPYGAFECADKTILIGCANDKLWRAFCRAFGVDDLQDDPRFALNATRVVNRAETERIVKNAVAHRTADEVLAKLDAAGIPCAPINTLEDIASHAHTQARGLIGEFTNADFGPFRAVSLPIKFDDHPRELGAPPPLLGKHTVAVLKSLGYADAEIAALERGQIVMAR